MSGRGIGCVLLKGAGDLELLVDDLKRWKKNGGEDKRGKKKRSRRGGKGNRMSARADRLIDAPDSSKMLR